jgi:tetratricopeptide (TPR) repeat protein
MTRVETRSQLLMEPGNSLSWLSLGGADYEKKDWLNAARYLMLAYITDPHLEDAVYYLASCLTRLGRPNEAIDVLEQYSANRPTSGRFHVLHGHTLFSLHEIGRALSAFEAARAFGENSGKLARWIGQCHVKLVNNDRAIASFQEAVDQEPGDTEARLLLARLLVEKGELAQARALCQTMKYGPGYSRAQDILAAINRLEDGGARHLAAPWPRASSLFDDLRRVAREFVLTEVDPTALIISPGSKVVTLGSCFAENLSAGLAAAGLRTKHIGFTEVLNSTYANRYFLDWLFEAGEAPNTIRLSRHISATSTGPRRDARLRRRMFSSSPWGSRRACSRRRLVVSRFRRPGTRSTWLAYPRAMRSARPRLRRTSRTCGQSSGRFLATRRPLISFTASLRSPLTPRSNTVLLSSPIVSPRRCCAA